jgi:peptidoglycan/xylan/chitin deacetylase (PgdA/CDA1 family)
VTEPARILSVPAKRAATLMLRSTTLQRAVRALARARGHRLVLVYHRLGPPPPPGCQIVPSVPVQMFKAQLQALADIVELVTLDEILAADDQRSSDIAGRQPAIAITFDDDLPSHATEALPALREMGVPAAFFLSGRALNGLGPYWFQELETLLATHGRTRTTELLGLSSASFNEPEVLALACERDAELRRRVIELSEDAPSPSPSMLEPAGMAALVDGGMTIGFHTVEHHVLPGMDDAALDIAVRCGRDRLAAVVGDTVRYFAYPHGKADARSVEAVRLAGFDAAFTGQPEPLRARSDRFRIGRWEPGPLTVDDLLVKLAIRLHRTVPPGRGAA